MPPLKARTVALRLCTSNLQCCGERAIQTFCYGHHLAQTLECNLYRGMQRQQEDAQVHDTCILCFVPTKSMSSLYGPGALVDLQTSDLQFAQGLEAEHNNWPPELLPHGQPRTGMCPPLFC
jgi:hypothetical protein